MISLRKIYEDFRGQIHVMEGDLKEYKEIAIFSTKKGFARGGVIHEFHDEFDVVMEGSIHYVVGDKEFTLMQGASITIPKNIPHYFVSLTDSLVAEWGCPPEHKTTRHESFRAIVDAINEKAKHAQ